MAYNVSLVDIESRWRPLSDDESTVALTLIDDATTLIDTHPDLVGLPALVLAGEVPERMVAMVVVEMVQRVLRNPDMLRGANVGADGGVGQQYDQTGATVHKPRLRLEPAEAAMLLAAMRAAPSYVTVGRVRSLRTRVRPEPAPTAYLPLP